MEQIDSYFIGQIARGANHYKTTIVMEEIEYGINGYFI